MKFSINKNAFLDELVKCNKIIDLKTFIPAMTGIYVEVTTEGLSLTSTNNVVSVKSRIKNNEANLQIEEVGAFLIKGKYIIEILRKMEDDIVTMSNDEPEVLFLRGANNEFFLNLLGSDIFPNIGFRENGTAIDIPALELKKAIMQTIITVDEFNQKIVLTGLNFKIVNNLLYISGTDRYRVSRKLIELDQTFDEVIEGNIPARSCQEISRILKDSGMCKVVFNETHILISHDNTLFQTTILDGNYPDINKVFPTDFNTSIFIDRSRIIRIISRADIHDEETSSTLVNLIVQDEKIIIKSSISSVGSFQEEFSDFELRGIDDQNIFFNSKYVLDALRTFDTESVEINLIDSKKPIVLTSVNDLRLSHIILPMNAN